MIKGIKGGADLIIGVSPYESTEQYWIQSAPSLVPDLFPITLADS